MSSAPLGAALTRRIARDLGEPVKRAVGWGGYVFEFVTFDHRHGTWSKKDGSVGWDHDDAVMHWTSCSWNFPGVTRRVPEHTCGRADLVRWADVDQRRSAPEFTGVLDVVCAEDAGHAGDHRCGSLTWRAS